MIQKLTDSRLANIGADTILDAYTRFKQEFNAFTRRARDRFEQSQWAEMKQDARKRLDLYRAGVDQVETKLRDIMEDRIAATRVWSAIKAVYSGQISGLEDWDLAETYFNSVTRRIFATRGVNPRIEFVATDFTAPPTQSQTQVFQTYLPQGDLAALIKRIILDYGFAAGFSRSLEQDACAIAGRIEARLGQLGFAGIDRIEMIRSPFFRTGYAHLVGRIYASSKIIPLGVTLAHPPDGIAVDAVLLDQEEMILLFSFTRSHFFIETNRPYDLVRFLKTLIPKKSVAELYISIGYNKHGKTEIYRELQRHIRLCCEEQFNTSPGQRGMVMIVFNMETDDKVFKVIRDKFQFPKKTSRKEVREKYDFVYRHDRAGRMVEAQEFDHLKFDDCCFSESLLAELKRDAAGSVHFENSHIVLDHAYVERRVTPLDIYIKTADKTKALAAVLDFGKAIKDLAMSNIFPGDLLIKNFGVTRLGRVVFYDYDEISPMTECCFRKLPHARHYDDELSAEPWFSVGEHDVFPEEFPRFLGLPPFLMNALKERHGDLFEIDFWRQTQDALNE